MNKREEEISMTNISIPSLEERIAFLFSKQRSKMKRRLYQISEKSISHKGGRPLNPFCLMY
jgi:hypothetical protein